MTNLELIEFDMSDTFITRLLKTEWTNVTLGEANGILTNGVDHSIKYREAALKPDDSDTDGHILDPNDRLVFSLIEGQEIFARGTIQPGLVVITLGLSMQVITENTVQDRQLDSLMSIDCSLNKIFKESQKTNIYLSQVTDFDINVDGEDV